MSKYCLANVQQKYFTLQHLAGCTILQLLQAPPPIATAAAN